MKLDSKSLEAIKVLSLVVIAISTIFIALWLAQIISLLEVIGSNLEGINGRFVDLTNREQE